MNIDRSAYDQLALLLDRKRAERRLADAFVAVMNVPQAMRGLRREPVLQHLAVAELWADSGGCGAWREILANGDRLPVAQQPRNRRSPVAHR